MLYLKNRKESKIENVQDLNEEQFIELQSIMVDIYQELNSNLDTVKIVGINVLFNQISKSQLCIHGHVEFMISDVQNENLGCSIIKQRPKDLMVTRLNRQINDRDGLLKFPEGIKIDLSKIPILEALRIVRDYENNINKIIEYGEELKKSTDSKNRIDEILLHFLSPAPQNYIYLTYYKDKMFLSCVPEIILERANISSIDEKNECQLYSLKINQKAKCKEDILLKQESPIIRPSIKISKVTQEDSNIKRLRKNIVDILERD